jgi:hypothetical protein
MPPFIKSDRLQTPARTGPTPVVRSVLTSSTHSPTNRRLARELVWRWVASRWPKLMPTAQLLERPQLDSELPDQRLSVRTSADNTVWQLTVAHQQRAHMPAWMTRAVVANTGAADVLAVETACSDITAARVIAAPAVLGAWVEHLQLEDGGIQLRAQPLLIEDEAQVESFRGALLRPERRLPFLLLARKSNSRHYGTDPYVLAQSVRGLAHVACLSPSTIRACGEVLEPHGRPVQGAVRMILPGYAPDADESMSPLLELRAGRGATSGTEASDFRRRLCQQLCRVSLSATGQLPGADRLASLPH